jgi:hypothetical protein
MPSLYEIDQQIMSCVDMDTGEIVDMDKLSELQIERETKLESVALWIKNLKAEEAALKAEKDAFAEREKQTKAKREKLSEWLTGALNGEKMSTSKVSISFRKSESVKISDIDVIPMNYIVETITESPDKVAIKAALKNGLDVPGCELELKNNISIK